MTASPKEFRGSNTRTGAPSAENDSGEDDAEVRLFENYAGADSSGTSIMVSTLEDHAVAHSEEEMQGQVRIIVRKSSYRISVKLDPVHVNALALCIELSRLECRRVLSA